MLLVLLGASVFAYGWEIHAEYVNLLGYLSRRGESFYANQSLNGLLNRALGLGPNLTWDGTHTQIEFNRAVYLATTVFSFVVLGLSFWRLRRQRPGEQLEVYFPLALLAATIASPVAYEHHFGFTLPLFWILFLEVSARTAGVSVAPGGIYDRPGPEHELLGDGQRHRAVGAELPAVVSVLRGAVAAGVAAGLAVAATRRGAAVTVR